MNRSFLPLLIVIQGFASYGLGEDWPTWRGAQGDGSWQASVSEILPSAGLSKHWKAELDPGYSGITVSEGMVFTMDRPAQEKENESERVICLDAISGDRLWEYSYPVRYDSLDYGKGPRASITIIGELAYGLGAMGDAFCLEAKTGKLVWERNLAEEENCKAPIWGFAASPLSLGDEILYHIGAQPLGAVVALNQKTGVTHWKVGKDGMAGYASPLVLALGGQTQLVCWGPNKIMGLPVGGGKELWSVPYEVKYGVSIAQPLFREGIVLVCGYWNGSRAIRLNAESGDAELLWSEEDDLRGLMAQPLYRDGVCYLLDRTHGLTAFELKTGNILWRDRHQLTEAGRNPHCSLVWTDMQKGDALALNAEGELVFLNLNPKEYHEYWREQVIGKTWAHPAFSDNSIFVRDDRQLIRWELPN